MGLDPIISQLTKHMIILDIETTGLSAIKHSMVSLGAVDYASGDEFYGECRAGEGTLIDDFALGVNGFTRAECLDPTKQTPADLYLRFLQWCLAYDPLLAGQQVGSFDILFLKHIHESGAVKFSVQMPDGTSSPAKAPWQFGHRSVDLHSLYYGKSGKSLSLDGILQALGLSPEPKPHNALNGARLERDAFKLLLS